MVVKNECQVWQSDCVSDLTLGLITNMWVLSLYQPCTVLYEGVTYTVLNNKVPNLIKKLFVRQVKMHLNSN